MEGWIKIHRQIKDHWIWNDSFYFKAWIGVLLSVNHEDKKILIQGELIECKRGQSILSLAGWVKCFGKKWTMQRVRTFFELLKQDQMITTEGLRKTTRITVCNYDNYQFEQQAKNKQRTSKQHPDNILITTNKNEEEIIKNDNNEKNTPPAFEDFKVYALENNPEVNLQALELKYKSWVENNWRDGNNKKIVNWKSKLLNTIPYLKNKNDGSNRQYSGRNDKRVNDMWNKAN